MQWLQTPGALAAGGYFCKMHATCRSASTAGDYRATEKLVLQR